MLDSIADRQTPATTMASPQSGPASASHTNRTSGKHRGSDPFSDVELGHSASAGYNAGNGNSAYTDDPYAERRSDEVDEYEMEQQQVL